MNGNISNEKLGSSLPRNPTNRRTLPAKGLPARQIFLKIMVQGVFLHRPPAEAEKTKRDDA